MTSEKVNEALAACKQSFVAVAVFSGITNLLMLAPAFYMLNVYDKAVGNNSLPTLWVLSLITGFLFLILGAMELLRSRILVLVSSRIDGIIAPALYDMTFKSAVLVGPDKASIQPLTDLHGLRQFVTGNGVFALFDAPWLPIYIWVLFMFHPLLGWMGVIAAAGFFTLAVMNQKNTQSPLAASNEFTRQANSETQRNLRNAEAVDAMGMLHALRGRWRARQQKALDFQERASSTAAMYNSIIKTSRVAVQSAAIAAGAYLVLNQEISPGMLIAGSILISRALAPVELAVGAWKGFVDAREQYDRINQMLRHSNDSPRPMQLPPLVGNVSARGATIIPPTGKKPVIANVSFDVPSGSTCMVIGDSGAGKSTLIRGLLGLWPVTSGEIRIDGSEPWKAQRDEFGPQVGYLPQDIELLEGSVSENIARFGQIESQAVIEAANRAGLHDFILALPQGYESVIGKHGGELSPGQRQRLALARALYLNPKLIVLDEPNSNLDEAGEKALSTALAEMKALGSTIFVVSHRTNLLPQADLLLVMSGGLVKDFGPTTDVLTRLGALRQPSPDAKGAKSGPLASGKPPLVETVTVPPRGRN